MLSQRFLRFLHCVGSTSKSLRSWLQASTVVPRWLPVSWQRTWMSYVLAICSSAFVASISLVLALLFPTLDLKGVLLIGGIVLVALTCGAGPSLLAALVSTWLLEWVVLPPHFFWRLSQPGAWVDGGLHLASWMGISILASQTGWARRRAEAMAVALRQAEQEAAARARELEAIFAALGDGVLVYDAQGYILRSNTAAGQIFGFAAQLGFASLPLPAQHTRYVPIDGHGQPLPQDRLPLPRILHGEVFTGAHTVDARVEALDGAERIVNLAGTPLRNGEGTIIGAVGIVRDVTERRRLEQQTREALQALLAMAEALVQGEEPDAMNRRAGQPALGSRVDRALEVIAARLADLTCRVLNCRSVGIAAIEPETEALTPVAVVGLSAEAERRWWARWQGQPALGDALPASAVAALHTGEHLLLKRPAALLPQREQLPSDHPLVLAPMRVGETLVGLLQVDGEIPGGSQPAENQPALLRAAARLGALVLERERLLRDRTEARANELSLLETQAHIETFLGMAGHELKTPLTGIKLSLQLVGRRIRLLQPLADGTPDLTSFLPQLAQTEHQVNRLERLVNDLLDVSRVRTGKLDLHLERVDLVAIVRDAVEEQRVAHPARAIALHLLSDRVWPVLADADRIGQVVINYLTNALKYSPADRPVAVGLKVQDHQARVWVHDEGPGVPFEERERIWERFHQVKGIKDQSGTGVGLGLGLHICQAIVERHRGQVGVESLLGQGSTFWFLLPLAEEARESEYHPG